MKPLGCMFVVLHLLLTGCIISYDFPKVTPPVSSKKDSLPCYVSIPEDPYDADHKKMLQAMAQVGILPMETASHTLPQNGRYCSIQIREEMGQPGLQPGKLAALTLVLPGYVDVQYTIEYEVYDNSARLKSYQYGFKKEAWVWVPLIAVFWVNWLNTSKQDALTATLMQFMQDAQRGLSVNTGFNLLGMLHVQDERLSCLTRLVGD